MRVFEFDADISAYLSQWIFKKQIIKRYFTLFVPLILLSCNNPAPPKISIPVEHINPSKDQAERRRQSELYCKAHQIPFYTNPNALFVDPQDSVTLRTKAEVVDRVLALWYLGLKSEGADKSLLDAAEKKFHIDAKLTPKELIYAADSHPITQQDLDAGWKYEDMHLMLWALGFVDSLAYPSHQCNVNDDTKTLKMLTEAQFMQKAKLRSKKEILDQADLILRLDWACVNATVNKQTAPGNLDKAVVFERHYALNWLIRYLDENWDDVSTDT